jgi:hypothetical protein
MPGSLDHEEMDIDYLKYDNYNDVGGSIKER